LDLVVDFLVVDFFAAPLLADLLAAFFAMASLPPFLSDKFTEREKWRQRFFLAAITFLA
jgi:hypothetical protein